MTSKKTLNIIKEKLPYVMITVIFTSFWVLVLVVGLQIIYNEQYDNYCKVKYNDTTFYNKDTGCAIYDNNISCNKEIDELNKKAEINCENALITIQQIKKPWWFIR